MLIIDGRSNGGNFSRGQAKRRLGRFGGSTLSRVGCPGCKETEGVVPMSVPMTMGVGRLCGGDGQRLSSS